MLIYKVIYSSLQISEDPDYSSFFLMSPILCQHQGVSSVIIAVVRIFSNYCPNEAQMKAAMEGEREEKCNEKKKKKYFHLLIYTFAHMVTAL